MIDTEPTNRHATSSPPALSRTYSSSMPPYA